MLGSPAGSSALAAWHWRESLTWRWVFSWRKRNRLIPCGFGITRTYKHSPGWNGSISLNLPAVGYLHLAIQPNKFSPGWKAYS